MFNPAEVDNEQEEDEEDEMSDEEDCSIYENPETSENEEEPAEVEKLFIWCKYTVVFDPSCGQMKYDGSSQGEEL